MKFEVPSFEFVVANAHAVIEQMAVAEVEAVKRRTLAGQGASGPLPRPKDGGSPLNRTGQLLASIAYEMREARGNGLPSAVVRPMGDRVDKADRSKARRARAKRLKRAGVIVRPATGRRRGGQARGGRNQDVASVLAYAPKDKRAAGGRRGIYDVFHAAPGEIENLTGIAIAGLKVALVDVDTGEEYPGDGEAA